MSKSVVRSVKNVTKGYSSVQVKVRNATSNENWGPTGAEMTEIAEMTFRSSAEFYEIMEMLDKRLNDKGKNWRHVYKSLQVLDYILHLGSELAVTWAVKNIYIIRTLREFQYIDEEGRDVGQSVRQSAKELTSLILDEERLRAERANSKLWRPRVTGEDGFGNMPSYSSGQPDVSKPRKNERRNKGTDEEDLEYRLALEASMNEAEEDKKRRESRAPAADDDDLARAIKLSKEEEELRRKELEQQNAASLFDDTPTPTPQQTQPTGWNQGYQQQSAVDWFGNPVEQQQQPQSTGYLNNSYAQPFGYQNGLQYQQPQPTGFDQMQYQQPQYMQPQQTSFNMNNPYGQQSNDFGAQTQAQQEPAQKPGSQNPWAHLDDQANLAPQPTGSNNPFASNLSRPQPQSTSAQRAPSLNTLQEQKATTQFSQFTTPSSSSSQPQQPPPQKEMDPHASRLNALLAAGDGQDTFGNVGNLRIPAQHTAPGTFVNSAGSGVNRLQPAQTGTNPFMQSQFTGMPTIARTQQQMPAQTGPATGGFGSPFGSNPFGGAQQQQGQQGQRQQGGQGGSLIDL